MWFTLVNYWVELNPISPLAFAKEIIMETTFNAWDVTRYGGPEVLTPITRQVPTPTATQVLIRIRASAVSRADGLMRAGQPN